MTLHVRLDQDAPIPLDVAFDCAPGELLALVGPSGSGKTTILRAISGLMTPASGRIVSGESVWLDTSLSLALSPQQRRVGLVFQDYGLWPHRDALGNVMLAMLDQPSGEREGRARALLDLVNLAGLERRMPAALSGGQQQRVALARALARDPAVLLLDEPFSAVDQMTRQRLQRELALIRHRLAIPIVLVTHDLDEAMMLADRIAVLQRGKTLQVGTPEEVRLRPASSTVARLLGQTNIFSGRLTTSALAPATGRLDWGGIALEVAATGSVREGETVDWLIPRDHVVLHRRGRPSLGERENPVVGTIRSLVILGEQASVEMTVEAVPGAVLNFRLPTHAARRNGLERGAEITVSLLADGIHLMAPAAG
ncbi:MAG TPA: ABC transporter ATP-binding protein [Hyphomicrobiaceae bacterium]|nr:ABC transporter ATP-binding protein [Hyphomicrobiaceae bacterium]